jgi:hypothetical protein
VRAVAASVSAALRRRPASTTITPGVPNAARSRWRARKRRSAGDAAGRVFADDHTAGGEDLVEQVLVREQNAVESR